MKSLGKKKRHINGRAMKLEFLKNHNGPGGVEEIAPLGSYVSYDGIYCSDMRRVMGYKPCVFTGCRLR